MCRLLVVLAFSSSWVSAQVSFGPLDEQHFPLSEDSTYAAAVGDIDGDGRSDVFLGGYERGSLLLGDGDGHFTAGGSLPVGFGRVRGATFADLDGDGDQDLYLARSDIGQALSDQLLLNVGGGRYLDASAGRLPSFVASSRDVLAADFDGDGDVDLAIAVGGWSGNQQDRLLLNDGTGSFRDASATHLPVDAERTAALAAVDVDGDGDLDLVQANDAAFGGSPAPNRLWRNDGAAHFVDATAGSLPLVATDSRDLVVADIDADGDHDLLFVESGRSDLLFENDGAGRFRDVTASRIRDWLPELLVAAFVDVDGDSDPDLLAAGSAGEMLLLVNDGTGTFLRPASGSLPPVAGRVWRLIEADFDRDRRADLLLGIEGQSRPWFGDGRGGFVDGNAPRLVTTFRSGSDVTLRDVDGDGWLDAIVAQTLRGHAEVLLNDGLGGLAPSVGAFGGVQPWASTIGVMDVDGDGDSDVLLGGIPGGPLRLFVNDGRGRFAEPSPAWVPSTPLLVHHIESVDVDRDGDEDLVLACDGGGFDPQDRLWINDGNGRYVDATSAWLPTDPTESQQVTSFDADGDGWPDLAIAQRSTGLRLLLHDGRGGYVQSAGRVPALGGAVYATAAGDMDGDGDLDLLAACFGSNPLADRLHLLENDGAGRFTDVSASRLTARIFRTARLVLSGLDLDGDLDVAFADAAQGALVLWNDGAGNLGAATRLTSLDRWPAGGTLAVGDLDADGDPDIVELSSFQGTSKVHFNLLTQVWTPSLFRLGHRAVLRIDVLARGVDRVALLAASAARGRVSLPGLGVLGLLPSQMVVVGFVQLGRSIQGVELPIDVPGDPVLLGSELYWQCLVAEAGGRLRLTAVAGDTLSR